MGAVPPDSIDGIYSTKHLLAMHTKKGFGTSVDLSGIRCRGTPISIGGKAEGVMPIIAGIIHDMTYVSQGNARRGSCAFYLDVEHGDFDEVWTFLNETPDDFNMGWIFKQTFIDKLNSRDKEANRRFKKIMKLRMTYGKGYIFFIDKANALAPEAIKRSGYPIRASNLCIEVCLPSDPEEYNFVCVLSSINLIHWDKIKTNKAVFWMTVFLDCINQEFIELARGVPGFEKSVKFAEDFRALGLGKMGLHSLFMSKMIPFESLEAHILNLEIAKHFDEESMQATKWLASILGEPKHCKGLGIRNATRLMNPPTKSTAEIMGGVSEGINPDTAMVFTKTTPAGLVHRVNPYLLAIMKERGKHKPEILKKIGANRGSVQDVDWLSDHEKKVFKTAFEMDMGAHLRLASARQRYEDQGQSLNLYIPSNANPRDIVKLHRQAINDPYCKGLYYIYSTRDGDAAQESSEPKICEACQ
jgi:ribonucleoside-diphosphate reductase alpha chain